MRKVDTKVQTAKAREAQFKKGYKHVKLTFEQAEQIRYLLKHKIMTQREVQARYGISQNVVYRVIKNLAYTPENPTHLKALPYFGQQDRAE